MKITQGFVAATLEGNFLNVWDQHTHTGRHINVDIVHDIEHASVFQSPNFPSKSVRDEAPLVTWVPVEVRREVILKGFGT